MIEESNALGDQSIMPVTMEMRENNRISYWVFEDPWTVGELVKISKESNPIFENITHKFHTLTVVNARHIPTGVLQVRQIGSWSNPMSGELVIVNAPPVAKTIVEVLTRLVRFNRVRFFDTEVQGWQYLTDVLAEEDREKNKQPT
jgi:hypothetical protein